MLSSLRSVIPTPQGLTCRKSPPASLFFGLAIGGRNRAFSLYIHPLPPADRVIRDTLSYLLQRTTPMAPTAWAIFSPVLHSPSSQTRTPRTFLHGGRRHLSQTFSTPQSGMSSSARHSTPSIAFLSRMGASTRGIALGSPHSSVRLHTSVWAKSPPLRRGFS